MSGCKLSPVALGLAFGTLWGLSILIIGFLATYYVYGHDFVATMGNLIPGFRPSIRGSIIGGIVAFIDAFIMGFLIAWLYNRFNCCKCVCCDKGSVK